MVRMTKWVFACFLLLIVCSACQQSEHSADDSHEMFTNESARNEEMAIIEMDHESSESERSIQTAMPQNERKVVYNAYLAIVISNYEKAEQQIEKLVHDEDGYIVNSSVHNNQNRGKNGTITARIPEPSFQTFLKNVSNISSEVTEQSVDGEDVTEEYVDLEARLKAKLATKKQLETFLEEAEKMEDLLAVTEQLSHLQTEIEQLEGRIKYLTNQSDYATVTISIEEKSLKIGELSSKDQNIWTRSKQLLASTINTIISFSSNFIVLLIGLSPILIPTGLIAIIIYFYVRKRKKKSEGS